MLQNGPVHGEQDDDALKGLEVEDVSKDVEMNDDDVLAQMEARLAKLARVSLNNKAMRDLARPKLMGKPETNSHNDTKGTKR